LRRRCAGPRAATRDRPRSTWCWLSAYTQWFERLGLDPVTVMGGGLAAIGAGYVLWRYNARATAA